MNFPVASLARPPARHPQGGGLSCAVRRAAFASAPTLPPPQRSGLRYSPPVGHGRGLASRPDCAGPGEGIDSARCHPCPENGLLHKLCPFPGVNRPGFVPRRSGSRLCCSQIIRKCKKKQPPHPKRRAAVAAGDRSLCVFQLSGLWPGWFRRLSR
jgi:hypothetical protein